MSKSDEITQIHTQKKKKWEPDDNLLKGQSKREEEESERTLKTSEQRVCPPSSLSISKIPNWR